MTQLANSSSEPGSPAVRHNRLGAALIVVAVSGLLGALPLGHAAPPAVAAPPPPAALTAAQTPTAAAQGNDLPSAAEVKLEPLEPLSPHPQTTRSLVDHLRDHHFVRQPLDDQLSSEIFDNYLNVLDPARLYFTSADIAEFEQWRYRLDDSLQNGDLEPTFYIFNRFQEYHGARLRALLAAVQDGVDEFDFTRDEALTLDREDAPWAANSAALDELWRQRLKAAVLDMRLDGETDEAISETLTKRYETRLRRSAQTESEDVFQVYANALTRAYDPHTQYFSPRTSENFNINMSLSLQGIGAVLRSDEDFTSIVRLVPAGPADKNGHIRPGDRILGVGQGADGPIVDVVGWRLDDVVELIRGPKDSTVRLRMKRKTADTPQIVQIVRDTVKLEEQAARSQVLEVGEPEKIHRIGVISIPTFYADFNALRRGDPDARSTTRDVLKLVRELAEQEVEGLVIDLRNNGGGSLAEANSLTGLFIPAGPTVQVKGTNDRVHVYSDSDGQVAWNGPLAVLVNRLSASASEIFAGAIQDYGRGIVMGSQTYGKGTVQTLIPLNRGQLKLTQAKFYRISGKSTQHQGVLPDIPFPEPVDTTAVGESALDDALGWDVIYPVRYPQSDSVRDSLQTLTARHQVRVAEDPEFEYLDAIVAWNNKRRGRTTLSLNEAKRRARRAEDDSTRLKIENQLRQAEGKPLMASLDELDGADDDSSDGAATDAPADDESPAAGASAATPGDLPGAASPPVVASNDHGGEAEDSEGGGDDGDGSDASAGEDEEAGPLLRETAEILADYISLQFPPVAETG